MKTDLRELEEEFPNVQPTEPQLSRAAETKDTPTAGPLNLRSEWNPQLSWWGTGWFEEWERSARCKK